MYSLFTNIISVDIQRSFVSGEIAHEPVVLAVPGSGPELPAEHLSTSIRLVLSSELHSKFGCRTSVKDHILKYGIETLHQRVMRNFNPGFKALLRRPPTEWASYADLHLTTLTTTSPGKGIYLNRCTLPSNSPFFDNVKIKNFLPRAIGFDPISVNYMGSTTRSFNERIFMEHESSSYRQKNPSLHYECMDTPGASHRFLLVARVPPNTADEDIIILEASGIAAMNLNGKGGIRYMEYLQQLGGLPNSILGPWGLNRSNALLDWVGSGDEVSLNERADKTMEQIVAEGGRDVTRFKQTKEQAADGGRAAAFEKSQNILSGMIQTGRIFKRTQNWNLAGHKVKWGRLKIATSEKDLRLWIDFHKGTGKHPQCWIKNNAHSELQIFGFKAVGPNTNEVDWVFPTLEASVMVDIAERIVGLKWRAGLQGKEIQMEKRRK